MEQATFFFFCNIIQGGIIIFEAEFDKFLNEQRRTARGMRLERLKQDLTGERKMLSVAIWPVLKSFIGLTLEHEIMSMSGMRIYVDVFYAPLRIAFESEGFVVHAENITRDRFNFERMRVRTLIGCGYKYIPFTWDELDKKPETCRRTIYELLGRFSNTAGEISVKEKEVLRQAQYLNRPFCIGDICDWLRLKQDASRRVLRMLLEKNLITPIGSGTIRYHQYTLQERAIELL